MLDEEISRSSSRRSASCHSTFRTLALPTEAEALLWKSLHHITKQTGVTVQYPPLTSHGSTTSSRLSLGNRQQYNIVFIDLDDTLVPTEWIRQAFMWARNATTKKDIKDLKKGVGSPSPVSVEEALSPAVQCQVQRLMFKSGVYDLDSRISNLIKKLSSHFGIVVVVTNARSAAWLKVIASLFPKWKAEMCRYHVPIIRAAAEIHDLNKLPSAFNGPAEYFQFWADLKRFQFSRVVATAIKLFANKCTPAPLRLNTSRAAAKITTTSSVSHSSSGGSGSSSEKLGDRALSPKSYARESRSVERLLKRHDLSMALLNDTDLSRVLAQQVRRYFLHKKITMKPKKTDNQTDLGINVICCIGDSEFELCAARELAANNPFIFKGVGLVKCKAGLSPKAFAKQLDYLEVAASKILRLSDESEATNGAVNLKSVIFEYVTQKNQFKTESIGINLHLKMKQLPPYNRPDRFSQNKQTFRSSGSVPTRRHLRPMT